MNSNSNINIAIDIRPTTNGNSKRGVGFYTSRLVSALQDQIATNQKYHNISLSLISNSKLEISDFDLVHYPFFDPFSLTLPNTNKPTIVTVHDLIPLEYPKNYPIGLKGKLKWIIQKSQLKKVNLIITDSRASQKAIRLLTNISSDKIIPIYLAADKIFKPLPQKETQKQLQKYHLPSKYVLYVGDINWNKNIPRLVNVCQDLKFPLVIVGASATATNTPKHPWTKDLIWLQAQNHSSLIKTGFVPDDDLAAMYNQATLYVQPSYSEGFGLTPLEAMQSGCPVIYSRNTSLAEIVSNAGLTVDPNNSTDHSNKINKLWKDQKLRQELIVRGLKQSQYFSWSKTAIQTLDTYLQVLYGKK